MELEEDVGYDFGMYEETYGKNIYMLFTGLEVRTGKIFCRDFKNGPKLLRRPVRESLI